MAFNIVLHLPGLSQLTVRHSSWCTEVPLHGLSPLLNFVRLRKRFPPSHGTLHSVQDDHSDQQNS